MHLSDHTQPLRSFRQADIFDHQIAFRPPNVSSSSSSSAAGSAGNPGISEFVFKILDESFQWSEPFVVGVRVMPKETRGARVFANMGLTLLQGQTRVIDTNALMISGGSEGGGGEGGGDEEEDAKTSDAVVDFVVADLFVVGGLRHGRLLLNEEPALTFTSGDLAGGSLEYEHNDDESVADSIELRVVTRRRDVVDALTASSSSSSSSSSSDAVVDILVTFPITIIPLDDKAPLLIANLETEVAEGGVVQIGANRLSAADSDSDAQCITFFLVEKPRNGKLVKRVMSKVAGRAGEEEEEEGELEVTVSFTQTDVSLY